ncbi:MAG: BatA domain-containing protein [Pedobacter sp.]|nr:BatA domain-containing protein [Pedobacter sp.]
MNFLYPGFLFSLLAVAIPVLIHLFNFRRFKTVYFSNVQFLKAAKEQNSSREKLKNLLILACRILAVAFLVLAFARPYLASNTATTTSLNSIADIYIDNSYSMETLDKEGTLLDGAKRKAKEIAKGFAPNDRFRLTTNDFEGRHQRLIRYDELLPLIDEIKISPVQRTLQQVLNRQQAGKEKNSSSYSYILSDFQLHFAGTAALHTDENTHLSLIRFNANPTANIAVDSIWSLSPAHQPNDVEKFVVQLHNYADEDSRKLGIKLTINNQQKALATTDIPAGKTVNDTLSFSGLSAGWQKGTVTLKDYPVTFDDQLDFTFKVNTGLNVLQISGNPSEKYIRSLFGADHYFRLHYMSESSIDYSAFPRYPLIVISDLKSPSSGLAQQLKIYLQNGGTVVIFPDLDVNQADFSTFLNSLSLPGVNTLNKDTINVKSIALKSSLLSDVFEKIPEKLDLPKVNRRFIYTQRNQSNSEEIMGLPFNQSFFTRYSIGAGQVYVSATSLSNKDSNFPQHPVFVPLLYKIAFTSIHEQPLYYTLGKDVMLTTSQINIHPGESLKLAAGNTEIIPELRQTPGKTLLYIADQVKNAGFYELKKTESLSNLYAFNEDRAESDLHYTSAIALEKLFGTKKININNAEADSSVAAVKNNNTELWKLCLVLCAVFLAVEVVLIRFFNHPKNIQKT